MRGGQDKIFVLCREKQYGELFFENGTETMSCWVKIQLTNHFQNNLICFEDSL